MNLDIRAQIFQINYFLLRICSNIFEQKIRTCHLDVSSIIVFILVLFG